MLFRSTLFFLILSILLFFPAFSGAQTPSDAYILSQKLDVRVEPQYPAPFDTVTVSVESYSTNLDTASISWSLDGKNIKSGTGAKSISFQAGALGSASQVGIYIDPTDIPVISQTVVIRPAVVDLIWQGDTYVPPFYKGRSLYSGESRVTLQAIPWFIRNGSRVDPKRLIYKWEKNGDIIQSGYGKDSTTFKNGTFDRRDKVSVTIESADQTWFYTKNLELSPMTPNVVIYENSPLNGVNYGSALINEYALKDKEVSFTAIPYFFETKNLDSLDLEQIWKLNGSEVQTNSGNNIILRQENGSSGRANLEFSIRNTTKVLDIWNKRVSLSFGQ